MTVRDLDKRDEIRNTSYINELADFLLGGVDKDLNKSLSYLYKYKEVLND